jgi:hypothetical protein
VLTNSRNSTSSDVRRLRAWANLLSDRPFRREISFDAVLGIRTPPTRLNPIARIGDPVRVRFWHLADILLRTECAFGGKADIALSCRYVCNMAQRHFILTLTMRTDVADGSDP